MAPFLYGGNRGRYLVLAESGYNVVENPERVSILAKFAGASAMFPMIPAIAWSIGLFIISFWWPTLAATIYVGSIWLVFAFYWVTDVLGRPKKAFHFFADRELIAIDATIRKYHLWLRWNLGCAVVCSLLCCLIWFNLWWLPRLLWCGLWYHAGASVLYYFASAPLRARLNPFSVYVDPARQGNPIAVRELDLIRMAQIRLQALKERAAEAAERDGAFEDKTFDEDSQANDRAAAVAALESTSPMYCKLSRRMDAMIQADQTDDPLFAVINRVVGRMIDRQMAELSSKKR